MGNLKKDGSALRWETKMAPGGRGAWSTLQVLIGSLGCSLRARGQSVITIDSCYNEVHDDLTFNVTGATMVY